jgi:hypothetical protein
VQIDANPVKILEKQFDARSVDKNNDAYMVTVPGQVSAMLPESLGYSGTKIVEKDNTTNITIVASPESVITNYLRKSLDADVMIVGESRTYMKSEPMSQGILLMRSWLQSAAQYHKSRMRSRKESLKKQWMIPEGCSIQSSCAWVLTSPRS